MLYTDGNHLIADTINELVGYAKKVGLNSEWLDMAGKNFHPHFDICGKVKQRILADEGVQQVSTRQLITVCKLQYRLPEGITDKQQWESYHGLKVEELAPGAEVFDRMMQNIKKRSGL